MLLLMYCLMLLPLFVGVRCLVLVCYDAVLSVLSSFASFLIGRESRLLYII